MGADLGGAGGGCRVFKALFGALLLVVFVWLLLLGILESGETKGSSAVTITSSSNLRKVMLVGRQRHPVAGTPDLIYASKRKVPSGPDPIHNRHVGETNRPPGRV